MPYIYRYTHEKLGYKPRTHLNQKSDYLPSFSRLTPVVRSYVNGSDGMGLSMFKHQCYCSTHVIYAFSDYGQFRLPRQLFAEEFEFMVRNIEYCMTFKDPTQAPLVGDLEVVCEFLHCLKLLGYTPEADPELEPLINNVYDYILKRENERGGFEVLRPLPHDLCRGYLIRGLQPPRHGNYAHDLEVDVMMCVL